MPKNWHGNFGDCDLFQRNMADETSSNLYHLGMNFEIEEQGKRISIGIRTEKGVSLLITENGDDVNQDGLEILIPPSEHTRFMQFLRQVADLIETKTQ